MKQFLALLKREYWEWKRVIFWTIGVFSFLLLLTLIPIHRLSISFENWGKEEKDIAIGFGHNNQTNENGSDVFIVFESDNSEIPDRVKQRAINGLAGSPLKVIKSFSYGILAGFLAIQILIIFIALFYFSDSVFKERSNSSSYFFRSQPLNDNWILLSKLKAGAIGIIGLTLIMLAILFVYIWIAMLSISGEAWDIISGPLSQINMVDLFCDLILYQIIVLLWLSPLVLFMVFISSMVKNRPLIIGIGAPILFGITLQVIFGENEFVNQIINIFEAIPIMLSNQNLINGLEVIISEQVNVLGSFWGDLFSLRTLISLIISGVIYLATLQMYRKNITTN
ncbi:MAG: hypothetical protein ISR90_05270 [Candidatus Marinimicrobia bacterium]|nr:hypothetical protein [Candidatus Neomarinimicrobiota bacterium]MBL7023446.1 hypothetical protein [Candidatus Neomarinimicrobiota bacterium]MBL7108805.1 hypothetical protein [Candidatus Neomarinimicrobiota bacterium]